MFTKAVLLCSEAWTFVGNHATRQNFTYAFVCFLVYYLSKLTIRHRYFSKLPGPPHSFWIGHIGALAKGTANVPAGCHPHCMFSEIMRLYDCPGIAYLDLYPARSEPMLVISDPDYAVQALQGDVPLLKHPAMGSVRPVTGTDNILFAEGTVWKSMRSVFNPGFAPANLMKLVPAMVEEGEIFVGVLDAASKSIKPVPIDELSTKVTVDIIGRVVLDSSFNSQTQHCELVDSFLKVIAHQGDYTNQFNFWQYFELRRLFKQAWYERRLERNVRTAIMEKLKDDELDAKTTDKKEAKHVIGLAVKEQRRVNEKTVDPQFFKVLTDNIRTFLFAGHDTTSSVVSFSFYLLSEHPEILKRVREEHDEVFGIDPNLTATAITENPILLNQLPLTMGVIKEVLRLYPPASTVRKGNANIIINTTSGPCATDGTMTWVISHAVHRDARFYPSPNFFIPERWLPSSPYPQVPPEAFRPFERGPRNCIGQELALLESRLILALVIRKFDFEAAFGNGKGGWAVEVEPTGLKRYPEGASQVLVMTAKPKDGLPLRVLRR